MPFANNQGIRVHYEVEGKGPPIAFGHGFSGSLHNWRETGYVQALRSDFQLILIDARGHGESDKPHDRAEYSLSRMARDIVAVLDSLGIQKAHYWGYSMGGAIGYALAKQDGARFDSIILGGAQPYRSTRPRAAAPADDFAKRIAALTEGGMAAYIALTEAQTGPLPPARKARLLASDPLALAAVMQAPRDTPPLDDVPPTMTMPCLLYAGDADPVYASVQRCAQAMPNAVFFGLPGLNHMETSRRSDLVLPHVRPFLAKASHP